MKSSLFGRSVWGQPIFAHHFGSQGPHVLALGGVHADETEGVVLANGLFASFLRDFPYQLRLTLVPCLNVDGFVLKTRANANGIDLNRNLPTNDWSPEIKNPRYKPGLTAGSEPENQALMQFVKEQKLSFIFSFHSWHPMLNINGDCRREAEAIAGLTGYKIEGSIGYPTPGCLGTYTGLERDIPTLTYEVERGLAPSDVLRVHVPAVIEALKVIEERK